MRTDEEPNALTKRRTGREGRSLETLVLASQGTEVVLTKIGQLAKRLPGGKIVPQSGPCDFVGVHASTGRMLYFDCKQGRSQTRLETRVTHLAEHQRQNIIRYGEAGAIAGILAECTESNDLHWIRWDQLTTRRPSIPWDECWKLGDSRRPVDWKAVIEADRLTGRWKPNDASLSPLTPTQYPESVDESW